MAKAKKIYIACILSIVLLSFAASVPPAKAAGAMTASPNQYLSPGNTVTLTGTGFFASVIVGIGFGSEVAVSGEIHVLPAPTGTGPFTAITTYFPIKPTSFSYHCNVSSSSSTIESDYTDNGDGTMTSSSTYAISPFVNYVTGLFGRSTNSAWDGYTVTYIAAYTHYQYNVTPAAGVTTNPSGGFTATITIPSGVTNGVYTVTAVDINGTIATASVGVGVTVPESITVGAVVVLSFAAIAATSVLLKKPKSKALNSATS
jgi:hypothetical protein